MPQTLTSKMEALVALKALNTRLVLGHSATEALELWCAAYSAAPPPPIRADQRARLQVGPNEPVKYRRVRLTCGAYILSEADNWYVPSLLTREMNELLDTTSLPFGKVVADLDFTRMTFATDIGSPVLRRVWDAPSSPKDIAPDNFDSPEVLFEHRALLYDAGQHPFSEVNEYYQRGLLDFILQT